MICPKCRTKYPDGVETCPDCGVELIGFMGEADAPDEDEDFESHRFFGREHRINEEETQVEMLHETVVDENDEFSAVVYKSFDKDRENATGTNPAGIICLIVSLLFFAASAVFFYLGNSSQAHSQTAHIVNQLINTLRCFDIF